MQVLKLCEELYTSGSLPDWPGLHSLPRTPPHSSSSPFSPRPWDMLGDLSGSEMGVLTGERDTTARGSTGDREPRRSTGGDLHGGGGGGASGGASGAGGGGGGSGSSGPGASSRCVVLWRAYEYSRLVCLTVAGRAFTTCYSTGWSVVPAHTMTIAECFLFVVFFGISYQTAFEWRPKWCMLQQGYGIYSRKH